MIGIDLRTIPPMFSRTVVSGDCDLNITSFDIIQSAFAYDTVATLGLTICQLQDPYNGSSVLQTLQSNLKFKGVSGEIQFNNLGERLANPLIYTLINLQLPDQIGSDLNTNANLSQVQLGYYDSKEGIWNFSLKLAKFRDLTSNIPTSFRNLNSIPRWCRYLSYIEFLILEIFSVFGYFWLQRKRGSIVVIQSQAIFMKILLLGIIILGIAILFLNFPSYCMIFANLYAVGCLICLASISIKYLRVIRLWFPSFKQSRKGKGRVYLIYVSVDLTIMLVILLCWDLIAPLKYDSETDTCNPENEISTTFMYLVSGDLFLNFIYLGLISYFVTFIPPQFHEARWTTLACFTLVPMYTLGILLFVTTYRVSQLARFLILSTIAFFTGFILFISLFVTKMLGLTQYHETEENQVEARRSEMIPSKPSSKLKYLYEAPVAPKNEQRLIFFIPNYTVY